MKCKRQKDAGKDEIINEYRETLKVFRMRGILSKATKDKVAGSYSSFALGVCNGIACSHHIRPNTKLNTKNDLLPARTGWA